MTWPLPVIYDLVSRARSVSAPRGPRLVPGTDAACSSLSAFTLAGPSPEDALLPAWPAPGHLWSPHFSSTNAVSGHLI